MGGSNTLACLVNRTPPPRVVIYHLLATTQLSATQISDAVKTFESIDVDGDDAISIDEYTACLKQLELFSSQEKAFEVFNHVDENKNGKVDRKEFLDLIRFILYEEKAVASGRDQVLVQEFKRFYSKQRKVVTKKLKLSKGSKLDVMVRFF